MFSRFGKGIILILRRVVCMRSICSMGSKDKMRYIESELSVEGGSGRAIAFSILSDLEEGEDVVYETRRHWATTLPFLVIGLLLARFTNALSLFIILPSVFRMKTYEYAVTDRRVLAKWGLFKTRVESLPLSGVTSVDAADSAAERLLGIGDIVVRCGDKSHTFKHVEDPKAFAHYIRQTRKNIKTTSCPPSDQAV